MRAKSGSARIGQRRSHQAQTQTQATLWEFKMRLPRKAKPKVKELGSGIDDLPIAVALVVEENLAQSRATEPTSASASPATTAELVERLTAIRERIWRLRAVFAVTLSHDAAVELIVIFKTDELQVENFPDECGEMWRTLLACRDGSPAVTCLASVHKWPHECGHGSLKRTPHHITSGRAALPPPPPRSPP